MLRRDGCTYSSDALGNSKRISITAERSVLGFFDGKLMNVQIGALVRLFVSTFVYYVYDTP